MKVLIVEDDDTLAQNLKRKLIESGLSVDLSGTVEDGLFQATEVPYDCLILDLNLPDGSGFEICQQLRKNKIATPILMLTARDAVDDKLKGLDSGADDYVLKPADTREVIARVRALIRRNSKDPLPILKVGELTIDPQTRQAWVGEQQLDLPTKEFAVLEFLARHSDEVVTRTMLMEHIWGSDFETFSNVVDVYIRNLRRKIDTKGKQPLLHTIRGSGYCLSAKR